MQRERTPRSAGGSSLTADPDEVVEPAADEPRPAPRWIWPARAVLALVALAVPFLFLRVTAAIINRAPGRLTHPHVVAVGTFLVCLAGALAVAWATRRWWQPWLRRVEAVDPPPAAPAATAAARPEPRGLARFAPWAAESAAYLAVLVAAFGRFQHFFTRIPAPGDGEGWTWLMWETGKQIRSGHLVPLHLPHAMYPYSINLLTGDGYLPLWVGGVFNVFVGPAAAYNLVQLAAVVSALLAGRWMAKACTSNRAAIVASACAFGASPMILARFSGHVNLLFCFPTALIVGEVVRLIRSNYEDVHWLRLAGWLALAFLSSSFYLIFGSIVLGAALVAGLITHRLRPPGRRLVVRVLAAAALASLVAAPFLVARTRLSSDEKKAGARTEYSTEELQIYSADLLSAVAPPSSSSRLLPRPSSTQRDLESSVFIGWALIGGLAGLVFVAGKVRAVIAAAAATVWVLTLGPSLMVFRSLPGGIAKVPAVLPQVPLLTWLPYSWIGSLPFLESIRTPARIGFALVALGAAALALVLGAIAANVRRSTYCLVLGVVGVLVYSGIPPMLSAEPLTMSPPIEAAFHTIASDHSGRAVVTVPDDCIGANWSARFEIEHEHPVVGCTWFSAGIPFFSGIPKYIDSYGWASYRCVAQLFGTAPTNLGTDGGEPDAGDLREMATDLDVGWVILAKHPLNCGNDSVRYKLIDTALRANADVIGEDADFAVFALRP